MQANASVVIERSANGWIVRPYLPNDRPVSFANVLSFSVMDDAAAGPDDDKCLVGWLKQHFPEPPA